MLLLFTPKPDENFLPQVPASFSLLTKDILLQPKGCPALVRGAPESLES